MRGREWNVLRGSSAAGTLPGSRVSQEGLRKGFQLTPLSGASPFPSPGLRFPLSNDEVGLGHCFPVWPQQRVGEGVRRTERTWAPSPKYLLQ